MRQLARPEGTPIGVRIATCADRGPAEYALMATTERTSSTQIRDAKLYINRCRDVDRVGHVEIGTWVRVRRDNAELPLAPPLPDRPSATRCPFCEALLTEIDLAPEAAIARVVFECADGPTCNGEAAVVPTTHRVLRCRLCKLFFTEPR